MLATLQASSVGTQECINVISTLNGIIGDLETTVMFAQAGTLNPEKEGETFGDHRENILKTAKNLVEDTKNLVVAAQGSQEQLATAAQNVLASMTKVVDHVKLGAAALGSEDNEAQVRRFVYWLYPLFLVKNCLRLYYTCLDILMLRHWTLVEILLSNFLMYECFGVQKTLKHS